MGKIEAALAKWQPCILSLLRFVTGLLFLQHGMQKVIGFPPAARPPRSMGGMPGGMSGAMQGPPMPPPGAQEGMAMAMQGPPPGPPPIDWHLDLSSVIGWSGALEFFGGILLVFGLFTRPVAFLLSGEMAVAYFIAHAPRGFFPISNGGEEAVLLCFVFIYLFFAGGGRWSADALIARGKAPDQG